MAGIGFDLKNLFAEKKGVSKANVAIKSVVVSTGPWLISIAMLGVLLTFLKEGMDKGSFHTLSGTLVYTFIFSMIISAPISNAVTRELSDRLYIEDFASVSSLFLSSLSVCAALSFSLSFCYLYFFVSSDFYALWGAFFFSLTSSIWIAMVFVSALKDYDTVVNAFAVGMVSGVFLALFAGGYELYATLFCFAFGMSITLFWLCARIYVEFDFKRELFFGWLFTKNSALLMSSALFFYCGMWVDKIVYWNSAKALSQASGFWFFPPYDFAIFLAYLTTIPTIAYFTVFVETIFYEAQREFLDGVVGGADLWSIKNLERKTQKAFFQALIMTALFQVVSAATIVLFATFAMDALNVNLLSAPLLRICAVAATIHILVQSIVVFLYYFDFQKESLFVAFCMFISNTILAFVFVDTTFEYTGYGYAISLLFTFLIAVWVAAYKFKRLSYYTFTSSSML